MCLFSVYSFLLDVFFNNISPPGVQTPNRFSLLHILLYFPPHVLYHFSLAFRIFSIMFAMHAVALVLLSWCSQSSLFPAYISTVSSLFFLVNLCPLDPIRHPPATYNVRYFQPLLHPGLILIATTGVRMPSSPQ